MELEIEELECLQEIINEEILSYLDSGYNIKDEYVILCRSILKKLNLKEINDFDRKENKMELDIEETLQEKFKNLKIEVDYVKIKMYSIKIGTKTIFYEWKDNLTFSANIENITYYIKIITGGTQ